MKQNNPQENTKKIKNNKKLQVKFPKKKETLISLHKGKKFLFDTSKKKKIFSKYKNKLKKKIFDIRRNYRYRKELHGLYKLSRQFNMPLKRKDFDFLLYYRKLMRKKIIPLRWPIYRISNELPKEYTPKQYYLKRKHWRILFGYKIRLIKIYHNSCSKWYMKLLLSHAPLFKQRMREFKRFFPRLKKRYLFKKRVKPEDQKKYYIQQKFNKKFKLFKLSVKKNNYDKYQYQLKLLQNQFIKYLQLTKYFYKQLVIFYKQFSFWSHYEKFFLILQQRIVVILHKLRYFSPFFIVLSVYYKILKAGLISVNGKYITSPYNCVWVNDNISVAYKLYCFEWMMYIKFNQVKYRRWNGSRRKKFFTPKNFQPYIFINVGKYASLYKSWAFSSKRINVTILIELLTKFWRKKLLPRAYNYINLQIISELLPYKSY